LPTQDTGDLGGLHQQSAIFLTDEQALQAAGRSSQVDTVAVIAGPGVDAGQLASRIAAAVPGAVTYTGAARADAEFLDIGQGRSFLTQAAGSLGGAMALVVMLVVAAALGLSIQQRRREMALLRAVAATPWQVHRMIGTEVLLVSSAAAVIGVLPGLAVSFLLRDAFAAAGMIPADFGFAIGPLPPVAAVLACVVVSQLAALVAARRAARMSPVTGFAEAAYHPATLGRFRLAAGYLLIVVAIGVAVGSPLITPGQIGQATAAGSALLMVIAVALLGPRWLSAIASLARRMSSRRRGAGGFLATESVHARSRQLSVAVTTLVLAITLSAVQLFITTTMIAAAGRQARGGLTADYVLTGSGAGLSASIAGTVRGVPGATAVTPVARTQVLATFRFAGDPDVESFSAQGITVDGLAQTMNLDVTSGSLAALRGDTVALSRSAAATVGAGLEQAVHLHLGDSTAITPRVVAIYGNGLGFGDVTLPNDTVAGHTASHLDTAILVRTAPGVSAAAAGHALRAALARYPV